MELSAKEPFHAILCRIVQNRTRELGTSPPQLAAKLGPDYRSFMYWLEGQRKFPAELVPKLCVELHDYELLDELERLAGRIAYHLPEISHFHNVEDVRVVQRLVKEVGEALEALSKTLEDGIVEKHELHNTLPELDDVIRECARLKHWLEKRAPQGFSTETLKPHREQRRLSLTSDSAIRKISAPTRRADVTRREYSAQPEQPRDHVSVWLCGGGQLCSYADLGTPFSGTR
jgi:hypothetical protein